MYLERNPLVFSAGMFWEKRVFGCCASNFDTPDYLDLALAITDAARRQDERRWDPKAPSTIIARRLFASVKAHLDEIDAEDLMLYCSIGTALDRFHGADAFFRVRSHVVFIDITMRLDKRSRKAFLFRPQNLTKRNLFVFGRAIAAVLNDGIASSRKTTVAAP